MKVLERFQMYDCKPRATPSEQKLECSGEEFGDVKKYREAVGSLIYAMMCTRPDIFLDHYQIVTVFIKATL